MPELTPEQIAAFRKLRETRIEESRAKHGEVFTDEDIARIVKEAERKETSSPSKERAPEAPLWWGSFLRLFQLPAMRLASAAAVLAIALFVGIVVFVKPSRGDYRQF